MRHDFAAIDAALAERDLGASTARHLALLLACLREYPPRPQQLDVAEAATILGVHRTTAERAAEECADAGYCTVKKGRGRGGKAVITFGENVRQPRLFPSENVQKVCALHLLGARDNFSSLKTDIKKGAPAPAAVTAPSAPAVDKHPTECRCGGTGWVDISEKAGEEALVRCDKLDQVKGLHQLRAALRLAP